ncbi:methyltransferase domain-containing protein, partial [bacterium]|nr:methyltransferase domain-containing protein [bacterium]
MANLLPTGSKAVVEYGPGTGAITRYLLPKLGVGARLFAIEVNPDFQRLLESWGDPRLLVMRGRAAENLEPIRNAFPNGVDAVVSGIPFSLMPEESRDSLTSQTSSILRPGGRFILYQSSRLMVPIFKKYFVQVKVSFEPRNIFPYFI